MNGDVYERRHITPFSIKRGQWPRGLQNHNVWKRSLLQSWHFGGWRIRVRLRDTSSCSAGDNSFTSGEGGLIPILILKR